MPQISVQTQMDRALNLIMAELCFQNNINAEEKKAYLGKLKQAVSSAESWLK